MRQLVAIQLNALHVKDCSEKQMRQVGHQEVIHDLSNLRILTKEVKHVGRKVKHDGEWNEENENAEVGSIHVVTAELQVIVVVLLELLSHSVGLADLSR